MPGDYIPRLNSLVKILRNKTTDLNTKIEESTIKNPSAISDRCIFYAEKEVYKEIIKKIYTLFPELRG